MAYLETYNWDFVEIVFTLKGKYDASSSYTFSITNYNYGNTNPYPVYPILESISGVGIEQDEFFPKSSRGSIRLDNSRDSMAFERRLTDLQATYSFQGAAVEIYISENSAEEAFFGPAELVWSGIVNSVSFTSSGTEQGDNLTIGIARNEDTHPVSKKLTRSEFNDIPDRSLNKLLPLVLGSSQQVTPYPVENPREEDESTEMRCAYATTFEGTAAGNRFRNQGIQRILAADIGTDDTRDSKYYPVVSAPNISSPVYQAIGTEIATEEGLSKARAFWVPYFPRFLGSQSFIVTSIIVALKGNGEGAIPEDIKGEISLRLHRQQKNTLRPKQPSESLATAVIAKKNYAVQLAGSDVFFAAAVFDKPVPIVSEQIYYLSIQGSEETKDETKTFLPLIQSPVFALQGMYLYFKTADDDAENVNDDTWKEESKELTMSFQLYGMVIEDFPEGPMTADLDGLGYSYCDIKYNNLGDVHPEGAQEVDDLTRLDLILEVNGLVDTDNTITGSPGTLLSNPVWQVYPLFHNFDGAAWQPGAFESLRFSDTHIMLTDPDEPLFRKTSGRTFNQENNVSLIEDIARNSYCTLVYDSLGGNGQYSLIAHGRPRFPVDYFDDTDMQVERYFVNDLKEVINAINMNFARRLDNVHFQSTLDQEELRDYSQTLEVHYRDGDIGETFGNTSYKLFGERRLKNENFDYISDSVSALAVAELFLRKHDLPYEYAQISIPFYRCRNLKMYDIIQLNSTELPSHFGTNPSVYRTDTGCGPAGRIPAKTRSIMAEIVAMTLVYSSSEGITMRMLCRLVVQQNDPVLRFKFLEMP